MRGKTRKPPIMAVRIEALGVTHVPTAAERK